MDGVVVGVLLYFQRRGVSVLRGSSDSTFGHQLVDLIVGVASVGLVLGLALASSGALSTEAPGEAYGLPIALRDVDVLAS